MRSKKLIFTAIFSILFAACATSYKAQPLPFKAPGAYPNAQSIAGAMVGAKAYVDPKEAEQAFGFDVRGAGLLPVQVVFDNQGAHPIEIDPSQTFLEDNEGNLWPILRSDLAYERATKYAQTKEVFKSGAYHGFMGAIAGATIGAAIGIVTGRGIGEAAGKGAAIGGAAGAVTGGASVYDSDEARRNIINDLQQKTMQQKPISPAGLSYGFIFFPGEAKTAKQIRLQIKEIDTGKTHILKMNF